MKNIKVWIAVHKEVNNKLKCIQVRGTLLGTSKYGLFEVNTENYGIVTVPEVFCSPRGVQNMYKKRF